MVINSRCIPQTELIICSTAQEQAAFTTGATLYCGFLGSGDECSVGEALMSHTI
jgi:hypothetical protein